MYQKQTYSVLIIENRKVCYCVMRIDVRLKLSGWGSSVIERLANDLQKEFPGLSGFSRTNVFRMQAFYEAYEKVAQLVRQIPDPNPIWHSSH